LISATNTIFLHILKNSFLSCSCLSSLLSCRFIGGLLDWIDWMKYFLLVLLVCVSLGCGNGWQTSVPSTQAVMDENVVTEPINQSGLCYQCPDNTKVINGKCVSPNCQVGIDCFWMRNGWRKLQDSGTMVG
jgi:hypothetical protein